MTLPLYFLRRLAMPGGNRLLKVAPALDIAGICPTCHLNVLRKVLMGQRQVDGIYHIDSFYHYGCKPSYYENRAEKFKVAKGNLGEEEYRFWIGFKDNFSTFAMCRACRTATYSIQERDLHYKDPKFLVGGDKCTVRLVNCYKMLEGLQTCLVCKKHRFSHTKWGVPLCESLQCHQEWKFSLENWLPLAARLRCQEKRAGIERTIIVSSAVRPYCQTCKLFCDNVAHDEIHAARIKSGQICGD